MTDPVLNPGETVIKKTDAKEYLSIGRNSVWITLTNKRLIIQRLLGAESSYPLSHVTTAGIFEYWPPLPMVSLVSLKLLRIDLDNGGAILLGLYGLPDWIQAIEQAKANAPEMPYTTATPALLQQTGGRMPVWVLVVLVASALMACCTGALILLVILMNSNFR